MQRIRCSLAVVPILVGIDRSRTIPPTAMAITTTDLSRPINLQHLNELANIAITDERIRRATLRVGRERIVSRELLKEADL
jgi:hypothetical protein